MIRYDALVTVHINEVASLPLCAGPCVTMNWCHYDAAKSRTDGDPGYRVAVKKLEDRGYE
jgi:hypothetical protein